MSARKPDTARYEYDEGVLQALRAIVERMEEGESLAEALTEDLDPKAHGEMSPERCHGFINVFKALQPEVEAAHEQYRLPMNPLKVPLVTRDRAFFTWDDDAAQHDPFVVCGKCDKRFCTVENGDPFMAILAVVDRHDIECTGDRPGVGVMKHE